MSDLTSWLEQLGLGQYAAVFAENDVDAEVLAELTEADLEKLGLTLGHRKKMLKAIAMRGVSTVQPPMPERRESPLSAPSPDVPDVPDPELRQLTVMFCDLVGSTELATRLGPEELRAVVLEYQEASAAVVARFEGHVAQYLGDGLLTYFGYPGAHEDDAHRAVRAGVEIIRALEVLNGRLRAERGLTLAVRIGIHTGPVVVGEIGSSGRQERLALGETPNIAARLQALAKPDRLVVGPLTHQLVRGAFECVALGPQSVKGIVDPLPVWEVRAEQTVESRFEAFSGKALTPLVGRDEELQLLRSRWQRAATGDGQVVWLSGEPGIGKSRLTEALQEHVAAELHINLRYSGSPYHTRSAWHPVIVQLERAAGFSADDSADAKLDKLEVLLGYSRRVGEVAPLLAALLSIPSEDRYPALSLTPQAQKARTLDALIELLERTACQPVLMLLEDAQWLDPTTTELFGRVLDRLHGLPILLVVAFRPEFIPPWRGHAVQSTAITLTRLGRHHGGSMVARVTGGKRLPPEVLDQILLKSDGVPLFVEELTKTVLESGILTDAGDHYEVAGPVPQLAIPSTLHDSLMARLDRLAAVKTVAQIGAVIGRQFSFTLLAAVASLGDTVLQEALARLVESELVFRRGNPPEATYTFKHALVQDAAYQSLLKSRRQQLHARVAQALEAWFPKIAAAEPELLAHHYTSAGLTELAIDYWRKAGELAAARSGNLEAVAHFTKGLELLGTLPKTAERDQKELALLIALGGPQIATRGYAAPEVHTIYARAREVCTELGGTPQLFPALFGSWMFYNVRGELPMARTLAEELLAIAESADDADLMVEACSAFGSVLFWLGEFTTAQRYLDRGIALYDAERHRAHARLFGIDPGVGCLSYAAWSLWMLGHVDRSLETSRRALKLASEINHPFSRARALNWAAVLHQFRREPEAVAQEAQSAIDLSHELRFPHWLTQSRILLGRVVADRGKSAEGIDHIRAGLAAYTATGAALRRTYYLALLAEPLADVGRAEEGLSALSEAIAAAAENAERWWEPELHRLKGELMLRVAVPDAATAAVCFQRALDMARDNGAKSLELRAAMGLGRLWQQDRRPEARQLMEEIYGWFTEGFDTTDLKEAKALLDELS
jgi:class 3 adenylate cyclase/predicted ATPase